MHKINLIPQSGIQIEGIGTVYFGATREKLVEVFGPHKPIFDTTSRRVEYLNYGFFADFKPEDDSFEAVEFWNNLQGNPSEVFIYGIEVLKTNAQQTLSLLQQKNNNEAPKDGWFIEVDVLYSGGNITNQENAIKDAKKDDTFEGTKKDVLLEELERAKRFTSFGIGYKGYCKNGLEMLEKLLNG